MNWAHGAADLGSNPLIVTGKHSARAIGALDRALKQLPKAVVFDRVEENPSTGVCMEGAALCREDGCDLVVAIGGGSPIDAAKAIAGLALNDGHCTEYFGAEKFVNGVLPLVLVPTTAGAGSEVTPFSVIIDEASNEKKTIAGRGLFAQVALLDPELTAALPRDVTIATGLDALSQAMEGIVSKKANPVSDALAVDAIPRIMANLPKAATNPQDLEARSEMLHAAMLAGIVVANCGTTLVHGMGYPYTIDFGIAHGLANALLLPPLFAHNAVAVPDRTSLVADALGLKRAAEIPGRFRDIVRELGVSPAARDHGVPEDRLAALSEAIASNPYRFRNQPGEVDLRVIRGFYLGLLVRGWCLLTPVQIMS